MLSGRLTAIYNLVTDATVLADVCTDHALLPIELMKNKVIEKAYACDIAEGPIAIATANIREEGLEGKVIPILADGLNNLPDDVDTVVIAGVGYFTVEEILENDIDKLYSFDRIVVQVNKDVPLLRQWISDHHFTILDEKIVSEGMYYQIIVFNTAYHRSYSNLEIKLGPVLLENSDALFIEYLDHMLKNLREICSRVPEGTIKRSVLESEIGSLQSVLYK